MDKIRWALVGCGGMGTRHLHGMKPLLDSPFANVEIAALCDIRADNAELAATEVEGFTGARPPAFSSLGEMVAQVPDLQAVDVVVDPCFHHTVVCDALDLARPANRACSNALARPSPPANRASSIALARSSPPQRDSLNDSPID